MAKKVLITGLNGTLAPYVQRAFEQQQWEVVSWDRSSVDPEDQAASAAFLEQVKPDAICHLAMGSEHWAGWLAHQCKQMRIPYLFTSTAMVFDAEQSGPYHIESARNAKDDYGQYKIRCEDAIWPANPDAMVVRIGWQIGDEVGGNNMLEHLSKQHAEQGQIEASTAWLPATSRMSDTANAIYDLVQRNEPGLFHLDSNAEDAWSFYQLVQALSAYHNKDWTVIANQDYRHDQRLCDARVTMPSLSSWLK